MIHLQAHQILRFNGKQIQIEDSSIRRRKPFIIRFFTQRRYNENRILSALLTTAEKTNDATKRAQCIDWAQELLKRAQQENPFRSRFNVIVRWLNGLPIILTQLFQNRLQKLIKNNLAPVVEAEPVIPVQIHQQEFTKAEILQLMKESLSRCTAYPNHTKILRKFITLAEKQEMLLAKAKELYKKNDYALASLIENETGFTFYLQLNDPILSLENAPRDYAKAYYGVRNDPETQRAFYREVFTGAWPCFAGNYRELVAWNEKHGTQNLDLIPQTLFGNSKIENLGALYTAYQGRLIRLYHTLYLGVDFKETNPEHQKSYNELKAGSNEVISQFVDQQGQKGFIAFLKEHKYLPLECKDGQLTADRIEEEVNTFYESVF